MVGAHIPLYSKKVVTNEMPVEAVHTLSLFKLNSKFVTPLTKVASLKHNRKIGINTPAIYFLRQ